ncbi:MAG: peptide chain release factor N(5)-glutamine methyltransferase [Myxococcales bacterium]|nr:peptide chain release factor N(5)-glutamine methyltransferase [Myxococcales bacterium]MCB9545594.1 peptide chain release factor N(5)-glutamine methyltransferase [Myxococcales bacterium]
MEETWTIGRVLTWTTSHFAEKGMESPRLDAELLIADALALTRLQLYTQHDQPLIAPELAAVRERVRRRSRREPVAYITGTRGFWSLDLQVDRRVLIPRPETELLIEKALDFLKPFRQPRIVDVGTGSGCIALTLAKERPDARVLAIDTSPDALAVAAANRDRLELPVTLQRGDLLQGVEGPFDLIVSNPPYIASGEIAGLMPDVARHEPRLALDGGPDGLVLIRPLIDQAGARLAPGGGLMIEIGHDQGPRLLEILKKDGRFEAEAVHADAAGLPRLATARRVRA